MTRADESREGFGSAVQVCCADAAVWLSSRQDEMVARVNYLGDCILLCSKSPLLVDEFNGAPHRTKSLAHLLRRTLCKWARIDQVRQMFSLATIVQRATLQATQTAKASTNE